MVKADVSSLSPKAAEQERIMALIAEKLKSAQSATAMLKQLTGKEIRVTVSSMVRYEPRVADLRALGAKVDAEFYSRTSRLLVSGSCVSTAKTIVNLDAVPKGLREPLLGGKHPIGTVFNKVDFSRQSTGNGVRRLLETTKSIEDWDVQIIAAHAVLVGPDGPFAIVEEYYHAGLVYLTKDWIKWAGKHE